jgi:hypothetical protein
MQFLYEVRAGEHVYRGTDLYAGVGMDVSASRMVGVLAGFLSKAGERYRSGMCPPDDAYPEWVYEQAYLNEDELAMASFEFEEPEVFTGRFGEQEGPWASVVFLQGEDADAALSVLEERGPEAAIAHLAQWDLEMRRRLQPRTVTSTRRHRSGRGIGVSAAAHITCRGITRWDTWA